MGLLLVVSLGLGVGLPSGSVKADQYVTAPAARGTIDVRVEAKGIVQPRDTVRVAAPGSGTVTWTGPGVGERVTRGQPLARFLTAPVPVVQPVADPEPASVEPAGGGAAEAPRDAAKPRAELEGVKADLKAAELAYEEAEKMAVKLEGIPDLVPRLQIEDARRKADAAKAALATARARVKAAEAAAAEAGRPAPKKAAAPTETAGPRSAAPTAVPRSEIVITSPIDGVVVTKQAAAGQAVKGGSASATLYTIGSGDESAEVFLLIPEEEAADVREGLEVVASIPEDSGRTFAGRLAKVRRAAEVAAGGTLTAVVEVDASAEELRPGTKVEVEVSVARKDGVLTVPAAALVFDPEPEKGAGDAESREAAGESAATPESDTAVVWVQTADGDVAPRRVEVGAIDDRSVEIVAGGLQEGDLVITGRVGEETPASPADGAPEPSRVLAASEAGAETPELTFSMTPEVQRLLRYYASGGGQATVARAAERSSGLRARAEQIFAEEGVPTDLVWLALVESAWRPTAVSPVGAAGIWQIMPATGQRFGLRVDGEVDERYDFEKATRVAAVYLRFLAERYDGNWELAVGAYNCGEGAMDAAIARAGGVRDFWTVARSGALPNETVNYVPAVFAAALVGSELG